MATKPDTKQEVSAAQEKEVRAAVKRDEDRKEAVKEAQEDDLVKGQQTGGTHDAVTRADVHVEPVRAAVLNPDAPNDKVVDGHDATKDPVDYAPKAELEVPVSTEDLGLEGLDLYVRQMEDDAASRDTTVVEISHPQGRDGIYDGRDSGIRMTKGAKRVLFSDGSKK